MTDFTDREKAIILVKYIVHGNSPFAEATLEKRIKMLTVAVKVMKLNISMDELFKIGEEIILTQGEFIGTQKRFIRNNKDVLVRAHTELHKGNESLEGMLDKETIDEALSLLKKGDIE